MKLENEPGFTVQTPPRKSYNPFDSDAEDTDDYVKNNVNSYAISFEENAELLPFNLENEDISWEEAILGSPPIPDNASSEANLFRRDTQLFTDKSVMECELPELEVCYKDNAYHNVKDIGIDEGVPTNDKAWIKSKEVHGIENLSFTEALNGDLSLENDRQDEAEDSMKCSGLGTEFFFNVVDELELDLSKKESDVYDTRDHQESEKMVLNTTDSKSSKIDDVSYVKVDEKGNDVFEEHAKDSSTKALVVDGKEANTKSSENTKKESSLPQSSELPSSQESDSISIPNGLTYNSKVESGSIILDFNNSSATIPEKEDEEKDKAQQNLAAEKPPEYQNISSEKPPKPQSMSRNDERAPGLDKWANGEASFSADTPHPASITYMGPNERCGSISLRSESSAGSTRSFAFPVLQAEWNSSPVRMDKADKRHFHKYREWVHSVICCRF